jgi:hypothetical protein
MKPGLQGIFGKRSALLIILSGVLKKVQLDMSDENQDFLSFLEEV